MREKGSGFPRNRRTIRLDLAAFNAAMAEHLQAKDGKTSNLAVANALGCGEGSIHRLRAGEQQPGPGLIACIMTTLGTEGLARVTRVCDAEDAEGVAA